MKYNFLFPHEISVLKHCFRKGLWTQLKNTNYLTLLIHAKLLKINFDKIKI